MQSFSVSQCLCGEGRYASIMYASSQPSSDSSKLPKRMASPMMRCDTGSRANRVIHCMPTSNWLGVNQRCGNTSTSPAWG